MYISINKVCNIKEYVTKYINTFVPIALESASNLDNPHDYIFLIILSSSLIESSSNPFTIYKHSSGLAKIYKVFDIKLVNDNIASVIVQKLHIDKFKRYLN